jgi:hypothetical protein
VRSSRPWRPLVRSLVRADARLNGRPTPTKARPGEFPGREVRTGAPPLRTSLRTRRSKEVIVQFPPVFTPTSWWRSRSPAGSTSSPRSHSVSRPPTGSASAAPRSRRLRRPPLVSSTRSPSCALGDLRVRPGHRRDLDRGAGRHRPPSLRNALGSGCRAAGKSQLDPVRRVGVPHASGGRMIAPVWLVRRGGPYCPRIGAAGSDLRPAPPSMPPPA